MMLCIQKDILTFFKEINHYFPNDIIYPNNYSIIFLKKNHNFLLYCIFLSEWKGSDHNVLNVRKIYQ